MARSSFAPLASLGSYKSVSQVASVSFLNCYVEGGLGETCDIIFNNQIIGSTLALATNSSTQPASVQGFGKYSTNVAKFVGNQTFPGAASGNAFAYHSVNLGLVLYGEGTNNDTTLVNKAGSTVMAIPTGTVDVDFGGNVGAAAGKIFKVGGTQVVGARGAAVANATDAASAITQLNALLARCRAHGLIAP